MLGPNVGHEERRRYGSKEQSYADLYALLIETRKSGTSFLVFYSRGSYQKRCVNLRDVAAVGAHAPPLAEGSRIKMVLSGA
jgi:hypothetical protein